MSFDRRHATYHATGVACEMFEEMKSFDAHGSYFVPFRAPGDGPAASMNFITDLRGPSFDEWVQHQGPSLALIAAVAHAKMYDILLAGDETTDAPALAPRERECLTWLAAGLKADRIAEKMSISPRTVEFHLKNARGKLGATTREQALAKAIVNGLIAL